MRGWMCDKMEQNLQPEDVFVTDGYPEYTYIDPNGGRPEGDLKDGLAQRNKIISIVGASKTGKSTLCDKYFGRARGRTKILVTGDAVSSVDAFWSEAYRQLVGGDSSKYYEIAYVRAKEEFATRGVPIVLDDFHYIDESTRRQLCRQMKNAANEGVRFIILNTPHRGDDPIRDNPDLTGRYFAVDMGFWNPEDLAKIARKGLKKLEINFDEPFVLKLAHEALGSPQLMQTLCLESCRLLDSDRPYCEQMIKERQTPLKTIRDRAVRSYDQSTQLLYLAKGPKQRGSERNTYSFRDGTKGDVYQALVKVLETDPPFSKILLSDMKTRLRKLCVDEQLPNIAGALKQLDDLFIDDTKPIEWDEAKTLLTVTDPHFYFYLRCKA